MPDQPDGPPSLTAPIERGKYFKSTKGTLTLSGGRLRFDAAGSAVFDVAVASIEKLVWHWYSYGGAFEATIAGERYFLSFVPRRPSRAERTEGLARGREWQAALSGTSAKEGSSIAATLLSVFVTLGQIFIYGCGLLLSLVYLGEHHKSITDILFGGFFTLGAGFMMVSMIVMGIQEALAARRRKR